MHPLTYVDEAAEQCEVCRSIDTAPHVPLAETCDASRFNEELRADLLFSGNLIALRAVDVSSKSSLLILVRSEKAQ